MSRTGALRIAAVSISMALVVWMLAGARWHGIGARLARLDAPSLLGVTLLFAASYAMRGARIHGEFASEIAGTGEPRLRGYLRILRLTLVHNALVNVLPFRSGEAAFPILLSRWFGIGAGRAIVSLLWLRAQDATVMLAIAALLWPGLAPVSRALGLAALVGAAWLVPVWARRRIGVSSRPARRSTFDRVRALVERATRRNAAGWSWTVGNWSVKLAAETWLVSLALGPADHGIATAALGALGAEFAAVLPVQGVAGFGTFEAGGAALMRTQGVDSGSGLEAIVVLHAVVLALALLAGALAAAALPGPPARRDA